MVEPTALNLSSMATVSGLTDTVRPATSPKGFAVATVAATGGAAGEAAYSIAISDAGRAMATQRTSGSEAQSHQDVRILQRDARSIKAHEAAHLRASGGYAGNISYLYQRGSDQQRYISGGQVSLAVPVGATPEAAISNMRRVRQAALAPADPSVQDIQVALQAAAIISRKEAQISAQQNGDAGGSGDFPHSIQEMLADMAQQNGSYNRQLAQEYYQRQQEQPQNVTSRQWSA